MSFEIGAGVKIVSEDRIGQIVDCDISKDRYLIVHPSITLGRNVQKWVDAAELRLITQDQMPQLLQANINQMRAMMTDAEFKMALQFIQKNS